MVQKVKMANRGRRRTEYGISDFNVLLNATKAIKMEKKASDLPLIFTVLTKTDCHAM